MEGSKDKCWNCDGRNMKAVETWFECRDCGATWVPPRKLGYDPVELIFEDKFGHSHYEPTKRAARKAAAARNSGA